MAATLGPASETDAVNEMLASIGEDPISSLDNMPPSGNTALELLRATSRNIQEAGFYFNTESGWSFSPGPDGSIVLPLNVLRVDATDASLDIIQRGSRLYDLTNRTFTFTDAVECEVVFQLSWDELSASARWYFTAIAIEQLTESFPGAAATDGSRQRNLLRAQAAFRRAELKNGDFNLITKSDAVQTILRRS